MARRVSHFHQRLLLQRDRILQGQRRGSEAVRGGRFEEIRGIRRSPEEIRGDLEEMQELRKPEEFGGDSKSSKGNPEATQKKPRINGGNPRDSEKSGGSSRKPEEICEETQEQRKPEEFGKIRAKFKGNPG